ncbi:MAG: CPBP family intramembrane metalloprotease [Bacteroidales bacterium]|jgi:membrane protease YdiL (CAAX protease family)|nr:CPBP family intramembrane metalloprotease [Bacteroidales bacterium]
MYFLENILSKKNPLWMYVVTVICAFLAANVIGGIPLIIVALIQITNGNIISTEGLSKMDFSSMGISENLVLFLMLIPFIIGLLTLYLCIKYLHGRTFSETVNGTKRIRWSRIFSGFSVWLLLMFVYFLASYMISPENFLVQFDVKTFLPLLFLAIIFIPIQTTFEELLFRGYLGQGVAVWTKNRWFVVMIPAVLFGLMHIMNPEISTYGVWETMPQYILFGLIFGFIAVLDDGIELSMGMHAANNIFACLFVTYDNSALKTSAIFKQDVVNMQAETIVLLVAGLLAIWFFAKKYKWNLSVMNKRIKPVQQINKETCTEMQEND